jgi:hypothetical protein
MKSLYYKKALILIIVILIGGSFLQSCKGYQKGAPCDCPTFGKKRR